MIEDGQIRLFSISHNHFPIALRMPTGLPGERHLAAEQRPKVAHGGNRGIQGINPHKPRMGRKSRLFYPQISPIFADETRAGTGEGRR
jgi:hypothetical protein